MPIFGVGAAVVEIFEQSYKKDSPTCEVGVQSGDSDAHGCVTLDPCAACCSACA